MPILGIIGSGISGNLTIGFGIAAGGYNSSSVKVTTIVKFLNSTETVSTLSAVLPVGSANGASISNNQVAGYTASGEQGAGNTTTIYKLNYTTLTISTPSATVTNAGFGSSGAGNAGTAGYIFGNYAYPGPVSYYFIDRIAFPSDTKTTLSATCTGPRYAVAATNGTTAAYHYLNESGAVRKLTYSTETYATISSVTLNNVSDNGAAFCNSGVATYSIFGYALTNGNKLSVTTDTVSSFTISTATKYGVGGTNNNGVAGYAYGGYNHTSALTESAILKLTYSSDVLTTLSATLPAANSNPYSMSNF